MTSSNDPEFAKGHKLPLIEDFYSIQGEGFYAGKAAYFLRFGGCDIGCLWCDTKFSWKADVNQLTDVDTIVSKIIDSHADSVVVTGGEPLNYQLDILCNKLKSHNISTFLETSGTYSLSGKWDWVCFSPKKHSTPLPEFYTLANELKIIVLDNDDFSWAEENAKKVSSNCKLFLQPEWSNFDKIIPKIVAYCLKNTQWQISLQIHKFMHIP